MDDRFNILTQSLFQKSIENCSLEEIQSFTKQYPYFAPAQFLLLKRLNSSSEEYKSQYQKALLFHHDPLSFDQLINEQTEEDVFGAQQSVAFHQPADKVIPEVIPPDISAGVEPEPPVVHAVEQENQEETSEIEKPVPAVTAAELKGEVTPLNVVAQSPVSELTFEPFHTVDYFASQGIKLSQEETPKDQLGKQLKSFTEWLKTMKRLPTVDLNKSVDKVAERKVEHLAEDSVQNSEVVTEAMAEVWVHQGNHQKAIEIYNKLSLLNPSKRAYFASKIDSLKKSF